MYLPYAKWLSDRDRFDDARRALREGGQPELGAAMLKQLVSAAVKENRFADAAHLSYQLATEALQVGGDEALLLLADRAFGCTCMKMVLVPIHADLTDDLQCCLVIVKEIGHVHAVS